MKRSKYITALALLIVFASCEDVVQVKIDQGSKLLVIDAFVDNQRNNQKIRLTYTDDFFNGQNPPGVKGATVVLKALSSNLSYNFVDAANGDYNYVLATTDTIAYVNHTYQLEVTYNGEKYTSVTNLVRTTPIDSISAEFAPKSAFNAEGYFCSLWAIDVAGPNSDYSWIKSFRNGKLYNKGSQINVAVDGAYSHGNDGLIFIPPMAQGITSFDDLFQKNDICRVEIHSISKETYNFLLQVQVQTTNSGLFATTPENIRTNIVSPADTKMKGIGWFNMAAVSVAQKLVQ